MLDIHDKPLGRFVSLLLCCLSIFIQLPAFSNNDYDSVIVKPKQSILKTRKINRLMYRNGIHKFQKVKNDIFTVPLNENIDEKTKLARINELKESGLFELVEPNYKLDLDEERNYIKITNVSKRDDKLTVQTDEVKEVTPNDKNFFSQYYLREINATKAWSTTVGSSLLVAILDTGVNVNHPDLQGKILGRDNFKDKDLTDQIGHGTEISGIIAANTNNNEGIAGIAWNTKILSIRVTDEAGQARVSTVVSALEDAYKKGAKIVQISLSTDQFSQTLKDAIKEAKDRGTLIISTGGNTGEHELRYPAAFSGVIGVGAIDKAKEVEYYSTIGEHISLVAPGSNIYTTSSSSSYIGASGTSFAAPQVAGAAALVWSIVPDLTNEEVRRILINSADDLGEVGKDIKFGFGLLNIQRAVELAKTSLENSE